MPNFKAWGDPYTTATSQDATLHSPFKALKNILLRRIKFGLILFDDAVFTDVSCDIYSDDGSGVGGDAGLPDIKLHSSTDSRTKAELFSLANEITTSFCTFGDVCIRKDEFLHLVLKLNGYASTGGDDKHVALWRGYPDPVIRTDDFKFTLLLKEGFHLFPVEFSEL